MNRQTAMWLMLVMFLVIGFYSVFFDRIDSKNRALATTLVADAPIKVNTVCIWGKTRIRILGEILFVNVSPNPRYPNVVIVRESSPTSEKLGLKVGAAYLSKEPDKYEFLEDVDLSLTDEMLAERFGVSIRKGAPIQK